ncbi:MAG: helix-turn-helix domain-containing protein [Treponema sp.]|nr:helix-turn-helix domain-containing protein [Treponema sp.]
MCDATLLEKITIIRGVVEGRCTIKEAAERLELSERRVMQLRKAFIEQGEDTLIHGHGNSGRHPPNRKGDELREKIIALKNSAYYRRINITHFRELLAKMEGIRISHSALSAILKSAGIETKRQYRGKGFRWRKRRAAFGEMLEISAVQHDWLGNGTPCVLHGGFDDASGRITGLHFCMNECMMGYLEVLRQTFSSYGFPLELYSEKEGLFSDDLGKSKTMLDNIVEGLLGIGITDADTVRGKGCLERLCASVHGHLTDWFKANGISDIEHANRELHRSIALYNNIFVNKSRKIKSVFEPLNASYDLDRILAVRYELTTDRKGYFIFNNFIFRIDSVKPIIEKKIWFLFSHKIGFLALHNRKHYPVLLLGSKDDGCIAQASDVLDILVHESYYSKLRADCTRNDSP